MQTPARPLASAALTALVLPFLALGALDAAPPRALPEGQLPADKRLAPPKDLNGYFPFKPPADAAAWPARAERIRQQLRVAVGLFPEPGKTPLNAVVHGAIDGGDFTVERVALETLPGFYLTASLYRPKGQSAPGPGVLCPHGHWNNGRFYDAGEAAVKAQIEAGAEAEVETGRNPIQARCVHLARLGCTVLQTDMLGYADNTQISYELAHRFAEQRPGMNGAEPGTWGLFSPAAESHLQSVMMLQTWNSVRSIDFLQSLPGVDPARIAVTGASGGGTQTFVISALDPRVTVSMPAVMVSTAMQGGCTCENCSLMRTDEGNVAFAALFAPKPLGLTTADDWTKEMATKGFPELKQLYSLLGAPDKVMLHDRTEFGHNYNLPSRQAMYRWFNTHLSLGHPEPDQERPHRRLTEADLTVWGEAHPEPQGGPDFEKKLLAGLTADIAAKVAADPELARTGWRTILDADLARAGAPAWTLVHKNDRGDHLEMVGLIDNTTYGEQVPALFLYPKADWNRRAVIWLSPEGKAGLYGPDGAPRPEVAKLLADGCAVCGLDLLYQGESLKDGKPLLAAPKVDNPREAAAYTLGYNKPLFVQRLHDVLTAVRMIQEDGHGAEKIDLVGLAGAGHWAAAANFAAGSALDRVAVALDGFRFVAVGGIRDPDLLPGAARYGDAPALLELAERAPWSVDEKGLPDWLQP